MIPERSPGPGDTVKAISLWEPWASLMRTGAKTIETRHWPLRHRGPLLICAAARKNKGELRDLLADCAFRVGLLPLLTDPHLPETRARCVTLDHLLFGNAVALVTVADCRATESLRLGEIERERSFGDFSPGRFGWMTRGLRRFNPFPVTGHQGLFEVRLPDDFQPFWAEG